MKLGLALFIFGLFSISSFAQTAPKIEAKITSMANVGSNSSIEVCGTALEVTGSKPLLVTIIHGGARYTVLAGLDGEWCSLIRRRTFGGNVEIAVSTLDGRITTQQVFGSFPAEAR